MEIRFYIDPETGEPHIFGHDVEETEVEDVLARPREDRPGREDSRVAVGQTQAGRYLRVIYVPDSCWHRSETDPGQRLRTDPPWPVDHSRSCSDSEVG